MMKVPTWLYLAAGALLFLGGFIAGRWLHWGSKPEQGSGVVSSSGSDGGMPAAVATATTGSSSCDAGVQVIIKPGKPIVIYLPGDAGSFSCPSCPELTVSAGATTTTGPSTAHADAPVVVVKTVDHVRDFRAFGLGPAATVIYSGGVGYGASLSWQPADWLQVNVTPTTKATTASVEFRFDL